MPKCKQNKRITVSESSFDRFFLDFSNSAWIFLAAKLWFLETLPLVDFLGLKRPFWAIDRPGNLALAVLALGMLMISLRSSHAVKLFGGIQAKFTLKRIVSKALINNWSFYNCFTSKKPRIIETAKKLLSFFKIITNFVHLVTLCYKSVWRQHLLSFSLARYLKQEI